MTIMNRENLRGIPSVTIAGFLTLIDKILLKCQFTAVSCTFFVLALAVGIFSLMTKRRFFVFNMKGIFEYHW